MNLNLDPHLDTHHVTKCLHDHGSARYDGGMVGMSPSVQAPQQQPKTLEEALYQLGEQLGQAEIEKKQTFFGTLLGVGEADKEVATGNRDTLVHLLPEETAGTHVAADQRTLVPDHMINTLISLPAKWKRFITSGGMVGLRTEKAEASARAGRQKRGGFFLQTAASETRRRIRTWLQTEENTAEDQKQNEGKQLQNLPEDYILDSYDRNGRYRRIERSGILADTMDKKA